MVGELIIDGIKVSGGGGNTATNIAYDNTDTTMEATNVQGAITELNDGLNELNSNLSVRYNSVRYNSETDMLEIYYNGVWNEWKPAGMQKFDFIASTILSDWTLTNITMTYPSTDLVDSMKFVTSSINSSASTTVGQENCYAICETPVMIKKGDKLKLNATGSSTGGNWCSIVAGTDGISFPYILTGQWNPADIVNKEIDLTTYAGSELYFRVGLRSATVQVTSNFTTFEISQ